MLKDDKGQLEKRTATTVTTSQESSVHGEFQCLIPSSLRLSSNYLCGRHSDLEHGGAAVMSHTCVLPVVCRQLCTSSTLADAPTST